MRSHSILLVAVVLAACSSHASVSTATPISATAAQPAATLVPADPAPTHAATLPTLAPTSSQLDNTPPAQASPTADPAASVIVAYLQARAAASMDETLALACTTWQSGAATEVTSFASMNAKLEGVTCSVSGAEGDFTLVSCGGEMTTTYGGESRVWDMSRFIYQVTQEAGQWKMCGYH
jgi:hypothetical protein